MSGEAHVIREMSEADIPRVMRIERISFPTPWTEEMFRQQLLLDDIAVNLICDVGDTTVGYAVSWVAFDEMHLLSIAVAPAERRKGIASGLLTGLMKRCAIAGVFRIILEVRTGNAAARKFYDNRGFNVIGIRKRYYADTGEDAIIMEREVTIRS
jgi:ribosomal-protein-alanine N-acetyltransferase